MMNKITVLLSIYINVREVTNNTSTPEMLNFWLQALPSPEYPVALDTHKGCM